MSSWHQVCHDKARSPWRSGKDHAKKISNVTFVWDMSWGLAFTFWGLDSIFGSLFLGFRLNFFESSKIFFTSTVVFQKQCQNQKVSRIHPSAGRFPVARHKNVLEFPQKGLLVHCLKQHLVDLPLSQLEGLVVKAVMFWPKKKQHQPLPHKMCSQPRISRQECIQAIAGFLCVIFSNIMPPASMISMQRWRL